MYKTVIVFDEGLGAFCFFLVDGDYRHLHGVYGNTVCEKSDEVTKLLYDDEGTLRHEKITREQAVEQIRLGAELIACGFAF